MARTQEMQTQTETETEMQDVGAAGADTGASAPAAFPYGDDDIIVPAAPKDGTRGVYGILPAPVLPAGMDAGMATATMVGLYYDAVRKGQSTATKAVKESKNVADEVNAMLATFKPDTDRSVRTIAAMRLETARSMVSEALTARGIEASEGNVDANLKNGYMDRRRTEIDAALLATLRAGYEVQKKTKGGGAAPTPGAVIDDL